MKVVQIIYSLDMGGIEEFSINMASCFIADRIQGSLILLSKGRNEKWCNTKKKLINELGIKAIDISDNGKLEKLSALTRILYELKPDIVILHHELNTLRILPAWLRQHFKLIQIQHSTKLNGRFRHRLAGKYLVDKYVGTSIDVVNVVAKGLKLPKTQVQVIKNGIVVKNFTEGEKTEEKTDEKITILAAGRFTRQKKFIALAQIFNELLSGELPFPVEIIMAGEGETFDAVKEIVGTNPYVSLPGSLVDLRPLYKKADIYVSYSLYEGLSLTLLEAMASGCVVVSTATSGSKDVVKNGENGILVGVNDRDSFLEAMRELISNRGKREMLAEGAVLTAGEYDFSKTYDEYKKLMEELVSDDR